MSGSKPLRLDFTARGRQGSVEIRCWPNQDPIATGHHLIADNFAAEKFKGFPVVIAEIDFPAVGPRAVFYWLQTVSTRLPDGPVKSVVDALHGPFYAFGHNPTFMDAPANPQHPDMEWIARTFLVLDPKVVNSHALQRVVGFRWGYVLEDGRPVTLIQPTRTEDEDWASAVATYRHEHPGLELLC